MYFERELNLDSRLNGAISSLQNRMHELELLDADSRLAIQIRHPNVYLIQHNIKTMEMCASNWLGGFGLIGTSLLSAVEVLEATAHLMAIVVDNKDYW